MSISWSIRAFDKLSIQELHDILKLRVDVFVVEQQCIYPELDGKDATAIHVMGHDPRSALVAYARILPPEANEPPHIGRVVVAPGSRGTGLATEAMNRSLAAVWEFFGTERSVLAAQNHLERFYERFGYVRRGPDYDWDGIPHVDMVRDPKRDAG